MQMFFLFSSEQNGFNNLKGSVEMEQVAWDIKTQTNLTTKARIKGNIRCARNEV